MAKQRILIVCQHFWPETFRVNDIADYFLEKGNELDVLCGIPNYPEGNFFEGYSMFRNRKQIYKGISIQRAYEIPRGNNTNARIFLNYISFPISSLFYIPRLLLNKYDKIFLYQLSPVIMSIAGILIGKIKKTETTMYILDLWPENLYSVLDIKNPVLRTFAKKISHWHYRHVDKLVVLSETMRTKLIEVTGISSNKIIIIPQAAEKIYESDVRNSELEKRFNKGFNLVFTGSLTPAQSFHTIIEAAKHLESETIDDINWIIVGDGMSRKKIEEEVNKAGLKDSFYFEGQKPIEEIPEYTAIADGLVGCLVKSDLLEATIPAKVMSYIASGKPLILAMDGEVQQLINNTIKGGYVGPTEDSKQLATNIKRLRKLSANERGAMSSRLKEYHFKHFERNHLLSKLYRFIFD